MYITRHRQDQQQRLSVSGSFGGDTSALCRLRFVALPLCLPPGSATPPPCSSEACDERLSTSVKKTAKPKNRLQTVSTKKGSSTPGLEFELRDQFPVCGLDRVRDRRVNVQCFELRRILATGVPTEPSICCTPCSTMSPNQQQCRMMPVVVIARRLDLHVTFFVERQSVDRTPCSRISPV